MGLRRARTAARLSALGLAAVLALAGCDSAPARGKKDARVVAEVNGEAITMADVKTAMLAGGKVQLSEKDRRAVLRTLVEQLVERRLMLQRFRDVGGYIDERRLERYVEGIAAQYGPGGLDEVLREEGIDRSRWEQAVRESLEIEQLLEGEVYAKVTVPEKEIRARYEGDKDHFRLPKRFRVRQIVVGTEAEARLLRAQIRGGVPFGELAREKSIGPERVKGGDLGYFALGELPESIEAVIKYLKPGEVSRPVRTSSGYHLLQVTERRSGGLRPLASVREEIREEIFARKGRRRLAEWLNVLKGKAAIRYHWRVLEDAAAG